ncbi:Hydroxypyruvate reductase [Sporomusa carbonis]|uniref:hydroxyacid dehydrogenase n=1 Tax=Sporomusa carbonis TaxID=3076075 RepID=UPI003A750F44
MKKVVLTHRLHEAGMKVLEGKVEVAITNTGKPQEMLPELFDADGLIIRIGSIDRATMLAAKNLKVIGRPGVGVDDVDVASATELGIPVVIAPGANTLSVAEHALALIFAAAKDILNSDKKTRAGEFHVRNSYKAFELFGKTLGLVGYGNIGRELARLSSSVGLKVMVYDPFVNRESIEKQGYQYEQDLDQLLRNADVISLHVPLTDKTKGLIGEREFNLMRSTAILVNCARGGVIDEQALAQALRTNRIHSAALDVLAVEPVRADDPLVGFDNVIITPHMAGLTQEAATGVATMAAEGVLAVINGEKWPYVANKEVYDHPKWKNK